MLALLVVYSVTLTVAFIYLVQRHLSLRRQYHSESEINHKRAKGLQRSLKKAKEESKHLQTLPTPEYFLHSSQPINADMLLFAIAVISRQKGMYGHNAHLLVNIFDPNNIEYCEDIYGDVDNGGIPYCWSQQGSFHPPQALLTEVSDSHSYQGQ